MPGSFCTVCRRRIAKGSRCARHAVRSPSNRSWHVPGAAKVRQQVLERDKGCAICGSTEQLEIHHRVAAADGGATMPSNLIVLCAAHHAAVEAGKIPLGRAGRP